MERYSASEQETEAIGREMAQRLAPGAVVAFTGDLGAGKTAFVRGMAQGLGISQRVTSPTFTIVNEYEGGTLPLFHFDMYRLRDADDLFDIGWEDFSAGAASARWSGVKPSRRRWNRTPSTWTSAGGQRRTRILTIWDPDGDPPNQGKGPGSHPVKILALESSAWRPPPPCVRTKLPHCPGAGLTHSQTLLPMVEHLLQGCSLTPADLDLIAVAAGPVLYGCASGLPPPKGWPGPKAPCAGCSTLSPWPGTWLGSPARSAAMDARRHQIYNARFQVDAVPPAA